MDAKNSAISPATTDVLSRNQNLRYILLTIPLGLAAIVAYCFQAPSVAQGLNILAVAGMIALGVFFGGSLLGFLFGIPRTLQNERPPAAETRGEDTGSGLRLPSYQVNTNLEQISDWLTKILVGVGLTQISNLPSALSATAASLAPGLGGFPSSSSFALAELIYFSICGFLITYLWTRLQLTGAFAQADRTAFERITVQVREVSEKLSVQVKEISEKYTQTEMDAQALNLVDQYLNASLDTVHPVTVEEQTQLNGAIARASEISRASIFYRAQKIRSENWQEIRNKPRMERAIPVFRALIASDTENKYYQNHGQLGFALKDQLAPAWEEAERELTAAIEMRPDKNSWLMYEFNRAFCRIRLDPAFPQDQPSTPETRASILADLTTAGKAPYLRQLMKADPEVSRWLRINKARLRYE